jgi:hypothetical protein
VIDEPNASQKSEAQPPASRRRNPPFHENIGFRKICVGALTVGIAFAVVDHILKAVDAKAWDDLFLEAVRALLKQNGPWPVILLLIIIAVLKLYHGAMMGQIKAKDDEIHRLVQARGILEEKLEVRHSSMRKGSGTQ